MTYPAETVPYNQMVDNVRGLFASAFERDRQEGAIWYAHANTFGWGLVQKYGLWISQACGIIAAMSPATAWETNMLNAEMFCENPDRRVHRFLDSDRKARKIIEGANPVDVLGGNKVLSFYQNVSAPLSSTAVTIDRHAHDAAIGRVATARERDALKDPLLYNKIADAYRVIAHDHGILPHQVQATIWLSWRTRKRG